MNNRDRDDIRLRMVAVTGLAMAASISYLWGKFTLSQFFLAWMVTLCLLTALRLWVRQRRGMRE